MMDRPGGIWRGKSSSSSSPLLSELSEVDVGAFISDEAEGGIFALGNDDVDVEVFISVEVDGGDFELRIVFAEVAAVSFVASMFRDTAAVDVSSVELAVSPESDSPTNENPSKVGVTQRPFEMGMVAEGAAAGCLPNKRTDEFPGEEVAIGATKITPFEKRKIFVRIVCDFRWIRVCVIK